MLQIKINVTREIHFPKTIFIKSIFIILFIFIKHFISNKNADRSRLFSCGMDKLLIKKILLKNYRISI